MKKRVVAKLSVLMLLAMPLSAFSNTLDWRLDARVQGEYNSNIGQLDGYTGDFITRAIGSGILRYTAPTQTQVVGRVQGIYSKYIQQGSFDSIALTGSLTLSQWIDGSTNIYIGLQPIKLMSASPSGGNSPFDMLYMGGISSFYPFGNSMAFGGYQFDKFIAEHSSLSAMGHTFFAGFRHAFEKDFYGNLLGRFKVRDFDLSSFSDARYSASVNFQYYFVEWMSLQADAGYTHIFSGNPGGFGLYNLGLNLVVGYNGKVTF